VRKSFANGVSFISPGSCMRLKTIAGHLLY
jgi:hypothetical protein